MAFPFGGFLYLKHSPELRQTRVLLPERFTFLLAPSALQLVVSPLVIIRIYNIFHMGNTKIKTNSKSFYYKNLKLSKLLTSYPKMIF
jgi:hypothetical protein